MRKIFSDRINPVFHYRLGFDRICRKIRARHKFQYNLNTNLSDLIYTRILEPENKRSSCRAATDYVEKPFNEEHDFYRGLDVLAAEYNFIQSEAYRNSNFQMSMNDRIFIMIAQTITTR